MTNSNGCTIENQSNLVILNKAIRQHEGLYSLNDIHSVSGKEQKHRPKYFLANQKTQELIEEIAKGGKPPILKKQGLGTFVCKKLVIAYASWISPRIQIAVIDAFLEKHGMLDEPESMTKAQIGHIYQTVMNKCKNQGYAYRSMFGALKKQYGVASYREIPASKYPDVCRYLSVEPLEGELVDRDNVIPFERNPMYGNPVTVNAVLDESNRISKRFMLVLDESGQQRTFLPIADNQCICSIKEMPDHIRDSGAADPADLHKIIQACNDMLLGSVNYWRKEAEKHKWH